MRWVARGARALAVWPAAMLGVALTCAALSAAPAASGKSPVPPEQLRRALEQHQFKTLDGRVLTMASLRGQVVVLNFWASWCAPCRKELPALDALQASVAAQGGQVVAISIDSDLQNVTRFRKAHGLKLPIVLDGPDGLVRELDLKYLPFTVVLDRDGAVALIGIGTDDQAVAQVAAATRKLVASTPYVAKAPGGDGQ